MVILLFLSVPGVFLLADRTAYWIWRRTRFERARRSAEYPLRDPATGALPPGCLSATWSKPV